MIDDLRSIHEAGHALVAIVDAVDFERVTLRPPMLRGCSRNSVRLSLGGPLAEMLTVGECSRAVIDASGYDLLRVVALAVDEDEIARAIQEVGDLLVQRWPAVVAIAKVLASCGELSSHAVALIVQAADAAGIETPRRQWTRPTWGRLLDFIGDLRAGRRVWIPAAPVLT